MLLRILKRRTSLEEQSPQQVVEVEFRDKQGNYDLEPSLYDLQGGQNHVVRTCAEHGATAMLDPKSNWPPYVDLEAARSDSLDAAESNTPDGSRSPFRNLQATHHVLRCEDEEELLELANHVVQADGLWLQGRAVIEYVRERVLARDDEWLTWLGLAGGAKATKWRTACRFDRT